MQKAFVSAVLTAVLVFSPFSAWGRINTQVITELNLTGQTGNIPLSPLLTPKFAGVYRVSIYGTVTQPSPDYGCSSLYLQWTDTAGPQQVFMNGGAGNPNASCTNFLQTNVPFFAQQALVIQSVASTPICFSVSGNAPGVTYDLFITVERVS